MRILFLDQSGKPGGAELSLMDLALAYRDRCLVALFEDGPFRERLEQAQIPVTCLAARAMKVSKDSSWWQSLGSLGDLVGLLRKCLSLSQDYDILYANTSKALVLGALTSRISGRPLVYHLRDILSQEHFSRSNLRIAIALANRCACVVIANSQATRDAFILAGGKPELCQVVYNGFDPAQYVTNSTEVSQLRHTLNISPEQFVIGHFSRLSPWKGQHVLINAVACLPAELRDRITILLVGSALFGEDDYVFRLKKQVERLELSDRVQFLGFRSDVPQLMAACDLVAHTSTAPEPFGRVIIEAMLSGTPVVAAQAGGAVELIKTGETGWLTPPGDVAALTALIQQLSNLSATPTSLLSRIAQQAHQSAQCHFSLTQTHQQINQLLESLVIAEKASLFSKLSPNLGLQKMD